MKKLKELENITFEDLGINPNLLGTEIKEKADNCAKVKPKSLMRRSTLLFRRAFSESQLLDILDHDLEDGCSYHCISGGDIDALSYLKVICRQQRMDYCLMSTWCMAIDDVLQLQEWVESGRIKRLDCYCGEIFPKSYSKEFDALKKVVAFCGGRVCIFRNHSKIFAGKGEKFSFAIESSANVNTNPRTENTTITVAEDIYLFYKHFFDGIKSFTGDSKGWRPWNG